MLQNHTYRVALLLEKPYGSYKKNWENFLGNERFEGFIVDILKELSARCGFSYSISVPVDAAYGVMNEDHGNWSGIMGEVLRGDADIGAAAFKVNAERHATVHLSAPILHGGLGILIKRPRRVLPTIFTFLDPFSGSLWGSIIAAVVVVAIIMWFISMLSRGMQSATNGTHTSSWVDSFWYTISALLNQGTSFDPTQLASRIVAGVWWFFCMIIVSSYTANLAAFFTVTQYETSIQSYEDLVKQSDIEYGTVDGTAMSSFFKNAQVQPYRLMSEYMTLVVNPLEGVRRVKEGNFAFIYSRLDLEYYAERDCDVMIVGDDIYKASYAFALSDSFVRKRDVDNAILALQDNTRLDELHDRWFKDLAGAGACKNHADSAALDFVHLRGVFIFLAIGLVLGLLTAGFQRLCLHLMSQREHGAEGVKG